MASVLTFRVFCPRLPETDAFPGAPRSYPQEDDAQTETAPGETHNTAVAINNVATARTARKKT